MRLWLLGQAEARSLELSEFTPFPKIPRLNRDIIITEKIDGTNAAIVVEQPMGDSLQGILLSDGEWKGFVVRAQSRNRFISPEKDNHGFARWVFDNADALAMAFGPGIHFGEFWGSGIQGTYKGIENKRFSLFNVTRWKDLLVNIGGVRIRPVPVLYEGPWFIEKPGDDGCFTREWAPYAALNDLMEHGSLAAPGFKAEGIVVFHIASGHLYKVTTENDEKPKGVKENE